MPRWVLPSKTTRASTCSTRRKRISRWSSRERPKVKARARHWRRNWHARSRGWRPQSATRLRSARRVNWRPSAATRRGCRWEATMWKREDSARRCNGNARETNRPDNDWRKRFARWIWRSRRSAKWCRKREHLEWLRWKNVRRRWRNCAVTRPGKNWHERTTTYRLQGRTSRHCTSPSGHRVLNRTSLKQAASLPHPNLHEVLQIIKRQNWKEQIERVAEAMPKLMPTSPRSRKTRRR
mmetsp:Transcript_13893/g.39529  ORF Transcript_13893/g.39529 Transcript_13893/m.39529 type:complete len:238 (-) Transcript_13893:2405-3118(-)